MAVIRLCVPGTRFCAYYPYGIQTMPCKFLREQQDVELRKKARCHVFQVWLDADDRGRWLKCRECEARVKHEEDG